jgi:hypothetical protein
MKKEIDYDKMLRQNERDFYIYASAIVILGIASIVMSIITIRGN